MQPSMLESLSGLYAFLGYFAASAALLVLFCAVYLRVTPYPELRLVREGKTAPAVSFGGAVLGFVVPLAGAIAHTYDGQATRRVIYTESHDEVANGKQRIPEMIVSYADATALMLAHSAPNDEMSHQRVGLALPDGK